MLINLLPDFLAVLHSADRVAAYERYFAANKALLTAYWDNYVVDPTGPHVGEIIRKTVAADRSDLLGVLDKEPLVLRARQTMAQAMSTLDITDEPDVVLMVGVGAANAGELVIDGRPVAFICLEHFTGERNPDTDSLGLDPALIPPWLAHEIAHGVRYTAKDSESTMKQLVAENGGYYSFWDTGKRATLRELLVNEGLATHAAQAICPDYAAWEYMGYGRRQYARIRELEPLLARTISPDLDRNGLGLRLRWLSDGTSDDARTVERHVIPERAGYFLGHSLVAPAVAERGIAWALRASTDALMQVGRNAAVASA
ncbi:MAG: hypothetical protein IT355_04555 [Gemmatimonadaceae bacterium]|nr:hypothetical protein [Gemmatimonadaceae bacterium]